MSERRSRLRSLRLGPIALVFLVFLGGTGLATIASFRSPGNDFLEALSSRAFQNLTDRNGVPLIVSYQATWNTQDTLPLHAVPDLLRKVFLLSEDRRFFAHHGVDWNARANALWQNLKHRRTVRGASTITEQTIRMIHPRPRTLWSKWIEGLEAIALERSVSKAAILEFYLNQIPYAANRRGIVQAARYYFDRTPDTLSPAETFALVVLARAPSGYDLYRDPKRLNGRIAKLADDALSSGLIDPETRRSVHLAHLTPTPPPELVEARHFARHVRLNLPPSLTGSTSVRTTLDSSLQTKVQALLDRRVSSLSPRNVHNAAALIVDRHRKEILVWVVAGATYRPGETMPPPPGTEIDPVLTPRQPGSALKPFLYGLALDRGWTAATLIDDSPLAEAIGSGLHRFRNYSGSYYGPIPLREALGNSLNIPALRTIRYVGSQNYLGALHTLGFDTLDRGAAIYDEGLALGDGEVTLFSLVQAYTALANGGVFYPLRPVLSAEAPSSPRRVYSFEAATLLANILSDPSARQMEFGAGSVLNLPVQTAVKTGTSTGYHDAWVAGFDSRYVVGLWMGNLDRSPMDDVTGSTGPALTLRGVFSLLNTDGQTAPLALSPHLHPVRVCTRPAASDGSCPMRTEWFASLDPTRFSKKRQKNSIELVRPTEGLHIAYDPRVPSDFQKFRFELAGLEPGQSVSWTLDGTFLGHGPDRNLLWPVKKGVHRLSVQVFDARNVAIKSFPPTKFIVK